MSTLWRLYEAKETVTLPREVILQSVVICVLQSLHCQFSPPQQLFGLLDFVLMNLASPIRPQYELSMNYGVTMSKDRAALLSWMVTQNQTRKTEPSLLKSLRPHLQLYLPVPHCFNFFQDWLPLHVHIFFFNLKIKIIKKNLKLSDWKWRQWTFLCWKPLKNWK